MMAGQREILSGGYPHPSPLPTRGRGNFEVAFRLSRRGGWLSFTEYPSPLWGGVRGGGVAVREVNRTEARHAA